MWTTVDSEVDFVVRASGTMACACIFVSAEWFPDMHNRTPRSRYFIMLRSMGLDLDPRSRPELSGP